MLTRIYVDNYKCFTDFSLSLGSISLLLGRNGSGKSSIFQVLHKLRGFVGLQLPTRDLFSSLESTRWLPRHSQKFGVDFNYQGNIYQYHVEITFDDSGNPKVHQEKLSCDQEVLVLFENEKVTIGYNPSYSLEPDRSAVASIPSSSGLEQISTFRQLLNRLLIVQVLPPVMEGASSEETSYLWTDSRNWVSWYRFTSQDQSLISELTTYLGDIFSGFSHFQFVDLGRDSNNKNNKGLLLQFINSQDARRTGYSFIELSDGQRALIALYALLVYAKRENYILCFDEPDNFLALAEIQPWLIELYDLCNEGVTQAILITHHPEIINYLGEEVGIWFERPTNGPAVAYRLKDIDNDVELPMAELVARGWLNV